MNSYSKEYKQEWYAKNRKRLLVLMKKRRALPENKEKHKVSVRKHYLKNRELYIKRSHEWYKKNRTRALKTQSLYFQKNKEKIVERNSIYQRKNSKKMMVYRNNWMKKNPLPFGYRKVHLWLNYNFGKANKCENKKCPKKSKFFTWALLRGKKPEKKRDFFIQLCRSCHNYYDRKKLSL